MTAGTVTVRAGGYVATGRPVEVTDTALIIRIRSTLERIRLEAITSVTPTQEKRGDELVDLFPGSGIVTAALDGYLNRPITDAGNLFA